MKNRTRLFLLFLIISPAVYSQTITDSIAVEHFPVRHGKMYSSAVPGQGSLKDDPSELFIITKSDSIFHFQDGKVTSRHEYEDADVTYYTITIRNAKDECISYANLRVCNVEPGEMIRKGDLIGFAGRDKTNQYYRVDVLVNKRSNLGESGMLHFVSGTKNLSVSSTL